MTQNLPHERIDELLAHSAWVQALALRLVRDPGAADDLVQETWLAALKRPPRRDGPVRHWLGGVVRNLARQRKRGEGRRAGREQLVGSQRGNPPSTDTVAQRREARRDLAEAILRLDEPWRSTVILRYVDGLSSAEIARREDIPAATVRGRLKRAIDTLRAELDARHGGERAAWTALLLPIAIPGDPSAPAGTSAMSSAGTGSLSTGLSAKFLWSCVLMLVVVGSAIAAAGMFGDEEEDDDPRTADAAPADDDDETRPSLEPLPGARPAANGRPTSAHAVDEVVAALRTLVGHPAWAVNTAPVQANTADKKLEGLSSGRVLAASLGAGSAIVIVAVYEFTDAAQARALVAAERSKVAAQIEKMKAAGFPDEMMALADGAGSDNALPGFRCSVKIPMRPGETIQQDMQGLAVGRVAIVLRVANAPRLDQAAQDEVLDHAAAVARNPAEARSRQKPKPRDFEGMGRVLRVRIEDADGILVPRAQGVVWKHGGSSSTMSIHGGEGALALPAAGRVQVGVVGAASATGEPLPLQPAGPISVDANQAEVVFRMQPGLTIAGTVRGANGKPAAGIRVEARLDEGRGDAVRAGPRAPSPIEAWFDVVPDPYTTTRTSGDGSFELVGLLHGPYRLRFLRGEAAALAAEPVVAAGADDVVVDLRPTKAFRVTVLGPDKRPIPDVTVIARAEGQRSVRTHTDAEGVATLEGLDPAGAYELGILAPSSREDVLGSWRKGWKPADTTVQLEAGWTLRGVVEDTTGQPIRAWVFLRDGMGQQTESDGSFAFYELPRRAVDIAAEALGGDTAPPDRSFRTVEPTTERITLKVESPLLTIRVMDTSDAPVPFAQLRISLLDAAGRVVRSWIDEVQSGIWRGKQPSQRFTLEVFRAESANRRALNLAPMRKDALGRTDDDVVIRLAPGGRVTGRVVDAAGKPAAGVELLAIPSDRGHASPDESARSRAHSSTRTQADGTFTLPGLGPGSYEVRLDLPDSPKPVRVVAGQQDVELALPAR